MKRARFGILASYLIAATVFACGFQALADSAEPVLPLSAQEQAHVGDAAWHAQVESQAQRDFNTLPSLPPLSQGSVKTYYLYAEVAPWLVAPGVVQQAWTYDGTVPGPTIHVRQGDRVRVILINRLPEPTTIHLHGLEVDPDMDGVPGMSQDAVAPGQIYVYQFTANSAGTYIYHTHFDDLNQLDRGLYGAIIVEPKTPEHYDRDYLMLLSSWRILSGAENYFSINGKSYPLTKPYMVRSGQHVRIREINISGTEFHTMHLHGHRFQVIAIDGQPVTPANRQSMVTLSIGPGETRDIAFVANAKPGTWMFHCHVLDHLMNGAVGPGGLITAVQYENAPDRLVSMSSQETMTMPPGAGGSDEGGAPAGGPPMSPIAVYLLGAIAGLTIFFGLPFAAMRGISAKGIAFLNALAIGILFFLLFDILRQASDPVEAALHNVALGAPRSQFFGLLAVYLAGLGVGLGSLVFFSRSVVSKGALGATSPLGLATMIAAGIGLHNFSEGLAIGQSAATGAIQLALLLIIGFGLHNMTEGFGIAAPLAASGGTTVRTIVRLGLIGGGPTFLGTIVGYRFVSPVLSVLFLTLAAGAIIYVISEMTKAGARIGFKELATLGVFVGFAAGLGTDLILSAAGA